MQTILMNRFASVADDRGALMDQRRLAWLSSGRRLPPGSRLVHSDCRDGQCLKLEHLTVEPLRDPVNDDSGPHRARAIVTAVVPAAWPGRPWIASLEHAEATHQVPLNPREYSELRITEANAGRSSSKCSSNGTKAP